MDCESVGRRWNITMAFHVLRRRGITSSTTLLRLIRFYRRRALSPLPAQSLFQFWSRAAVARGRSIPAARDESPDHLWKWTSSRVKLDTWISGSRYSCRSKLPSTLHARECNFFHFLRALGDPIQGCEDVSGRTERRCFFERRSCNSIFQPLAWFLYCLKITDFII